MSNTLDVRIETSSVSETTVQMRKQTAFVEQMCSVSGSISKIILTLITGCLTAAIFILEAEDVSLLIGDGIVTLPIVSFSVGMITFWVLVPLTFLFVYALLHYYVVFLVNLIVNSREVFGCLDEVDNAFLPWLGGGVLYFFVEDKSVDSFERVLKFVRSVSVLFLVYGLGPSYILFQCIMLLKLENMAMLLVLGSVLCLMMVIAVLSVVNLWRAVVGRDGWKPFAALWAVRAFCLVLLCATFSWYRLGMERMPFKWLYLDIQKGEFSVLPESWRELGENHQLRKVAGRDFSGKKVRFANADGAIFVGSNLSDASFDGSSLRLADLRGVDISSASFSRAVLDGVKISRIYGEETKWRKAEIKNIIGRDVSLPGADFLETKWEHVKLRKDDNVVSVLRGANFQYSNFLRGGKEPYPNVLRGASFQQADVSNCSFVGVDFSETNFSRATFVNVSFDSCRVSGMQMNGGVLDNVKFINCSLNGAQFNGVEIISLSFANSFLMGSGFLNCSLGEVDFGNAPLRGSSFEGTDVTGAKADGVPLSEVLARGK